MGDGITEAMRDVDLVDKIKKIRNLQGYFNDNPSQTLAENIIDGLLELRIMKRGYWQSFNYNAIDKDLIQYQDYLSSINKV